MIIQFDRDAPDVQPTTPHDPEHPDDDPDSLPLPPDSNPQPAAPVREPNDHPPIEDPSMPEPTRLA